MKIPCNIIQDLLPIYIDGCTSEKTNQDIQEHLSECTACHQMYEEMKKPLPVQENNDIDYLKRIKKNQFMKIVCAIGIPCLIFITVLFAKDFIIGYHTSFADINHISIENQTIIVNASAMNKNETLVNYRYELDGDSKQFLSFQTVKKSFLHSSDQLEFRIPFSEINQNLVIGNKVISNTGKVYDKDIIDMVDERIPYVGDHSGVGNLLYLVSMQEEGDYHIALQTSKEPYSIKIIFDETLPSFQKERVIKKCQMVLACIDNCDTIYFESNSQTEKVVYQKNIKNYDEMQTLKDS